MNINDLDFQQTTEPQMGYDTVLSAGICDTCSIPKMMNTGDGINEPPDPIFYCHKIKRQVGLYVNFGKETIQRLGSFHYI